MADFVEKFSDASILADFSGIFVILLVVSALFWVLIGRFKLHNLLINIYISFAIMKVASKEAAALGEYAPILIFLGLVFFFTLMDNAVFEIHLSGSGLKIWQVIILSVLEAGLLVSIVASLVSKKLVLEYISENSIQYLISPWANIFWMVVPLLFLILIGRRK